MQIVVKMPQTETAGGIAVSLISMHRSTMTKKVAPGSMNAGAQIAVYSLLGWRNSIQQKQ